MTAIVNGAIVFDQDELDWFVEHYGTTEWAVYAAGIDETTTHDMQNPGDDPWGEPFTEASARAYLAEMDARFGPGSPMDLELPGDPLFAVALHYGVPAFGSHQHSYPVQPPSGTMSAPGNCLCGHPYADVEAALADEMAAIPWSVYVTGPNVNLVAQGQDIDDFDPCGPPFTEDTTKAHAAELNKFFARIKAENPSPFDATMSAVVLHHGQPIADEQPRLIKNTTEPIRHPWPADCLVQGGDRGVVNDGGQWYRTAFVEAFPGTFLRGEGQTIAEAEDKCWALYQRMATCEHGDFDRRGYTNGGGFCGRCGTFFSNIFRPLPPDPNRVPSLMERALLGDVNAAAQAVALVAGAGVLPTRPEAGDADR